MPAGLFRASSALMDSSLSCMGLIRSLSALTSVYPSPWEEDQTTASLGCALVERIP